MQNTANFSPSSKVWVYQSSRPFTAQEIDMLNTKLAGFAVQWTAHNKQLIAMGEIFEDRFIVLMVDETHTAASGCSIDTSVHFIKELEIMLGISLFDRTIINYLSPIGLQSTTISELPTLIESGSISSETLVFDPLVTTKRDFDTAFKVPLANTWMKNFI